MNQELQLGGLAAEINTLHDAAEQMAKSALHYAARCGEKLNQAKAQVNHGGWLQWLEENCRVKERQAQKYMKLASEMPELISNTNDRSHFVDVNAAMRYLSAPDEVKQKADAHEGTVTEAQIKQWKKEVEEKDKAIAMLSEECETHKQNANEYADATARWIASFKELKEKKDQVKEVFPSDYEELKAAAAALKEREAEAEQARKEIAKIKAQQSESIAKGIKDGLKHQQDDIDMKERQLQSLEKRVEVLRETRDKLEKNVGGDQAYQYAINKLEKVIAELSIVVYDLGEDGQGASQAMREKLNKPLSKLKDAVAIMEKMI